MSALTSPRAVRNRQSKAKVQRSRRKAKKEPRTVRHRGRDTYQMSDSSLRSYKRDTKRSLKAAHGVTSGRQWVRLRRRLQREDMAERRTRAAA